MDLVKQISFKLSYRVSSEH